ncbi:MAG TPA: hypothetical protein DDX92_06110 [Flavobacteriales bacterium]|nr:hypothetical protein [Flavobacteriales bacterium]
MIHKLIKISIFSQHYSTLFSLVVVLLIAGCLNAQNERPWHKHGYKSLEEGDFYGAAYYFSKALENDSSNLEVLWSLAESYRLNGDYDKALGAYHALLERDRESTYVLSSFYVGEMNQYLSRYQKAIEFFNLFEEQPRANETGKLKISAQRRKSCEYALMNRHTTDSLSIKNAGYGINSFDAEYGPVFIEDSTMFITSARYDSNTTKLIKEKEFQFKTILYSIDFRSEPFSIRQEQVSIEPLSYVSSVSNPDSRNEYYITICKSNVCGIFRISRIEDGWSEPEDLGAFFNNADFNTLHPSVGRIGAKEYLFFASDRKERNGMDIWYSEIKTDGQLTRPRSAGSSINSIEDEVTPFYDSENERLYFSSKWHEGFGGYDVFFVEGSPGNFGQPINAGRPLNSSVNDLYFSHNPSVSMGSIVSNRTGGYALKGENCCNDVYLIEYPDSVKIEMDTVPDLAIEQSDDLVKKLDGLKMLPLSLYFANNLPNPGSLSSTTSANFADLTREYYKSQEEYLGHNRETGWVDVFFNKEVQFGVEALHQLCDSLLIYLSKGYVFHLGIKGYTSPLGNTSYNEKLAQRRIASIENFIRNWNSGKLGNFLDSGKLNVVPTPYGEFFSEGKINDQWEERTKSIYSYDAAKSRKVEIVWVSQINPDYKGPVLVLENDAFDLGGPEIGSIVELKIPIANVGDSTLAIDGITSSHPGFHMVEPITVKPGESLNVTVQFIVSEYADIQVFGIVLHNNSSIENVPVFLKLKKEP